MASIKLYTAIYVALLVLAVSKVIFMELLDYWPAVGMIFLSAIAKSALIAGYYQHLKDEPRSITWLVLLAVGAVLLLAAAATYSIT